MLTYRILAETEGYCHIPNAPNLGAGAPLTLCGWCDVPYKESEHPPNCPGCLAIVEYCKQLKIEGSLK